METRARYVLVGVFTLAVTAAAFAFVYWLNTIGGLQQRAYYKVQFENTVSGLLTGSAVLFNGVRVGEVTALELNAESPRQVTATIAIEADTPVRTDTTAGIEFQGLMGAPAVSLRGGQSSSPLEAASPDAMASLVADPAAGQTMTDAARGALQRIDKLVSDNSEPLHSTIDNLSKFSDVLGRNSDRIDGILAGLERMTGGAAKGAATVYDLTAPKTFPSFEKPPSVQLVVREPTTSFVMAQDALMRRGDGGLVALQAGAKWSDMLPNVFQSRIIQSFENAGFLREVMRPVDGVNGDFQLLTDLRAFELVAGAQPTVEVSFTAKVVAADGRVIDARLFSASLPADGGEPRAAAASMDAAFGKLVTELVVWTANAIRGTSQ
jgi:phospholipid/cholesterol/gamma-HCH transport system substrate-binding protein